MPSFMMIQVVLGLPVVDLLSFMGLLQSFVAYTNV